MINDRDLIIETKRASGAGGQHVNKTDSAIRMHHKPTGKKNSKYCFEFLLFDCIVSYNFSIPLSGVIVECQTDRSQIKNRKLALQKLRTIIYKKQLEQQQSLTRSARKQQVNSSNIIVYLVIVLNFNYYSITYNINIMFAGWF